MRDAVEIVEAFKGQLAWTSEERVLDIGCGPGTVTAQVILPILPPDATIIGSDISESMIKFANDEYGGARLKFKQMDIVSKDIWDKWNEETFNKIFSFYCLHWIQDQQ
ncbi:hypothetical protein AAG570_003501 [Ranatra chinensis]|uniref:Methyltransferase domain-containing protein n=1 Tax=Ranatra chinensis TaxID=642074 RepID=A0ABD0Y3W0_9HEMI